MVVMVMVRRLGLVVVMVVMVMVVATMSFITALLAAFEHLLVMLGKLISTLVPALGPPLILATVYLLLMVVVLLLTPCMALQLSTAVAYFALEALLMAVQISMLDEHGRVLVPRALFIAGCA